MKALFFLFLFSSFSLLSDRIQFKNGDRLTGKVWTESETIVIFESSHGFYKIKTMEIEDIIYEPGRIFRLILRSGESYLITPLISQKKRLTYLKENQQDFLDWHLIHILRQIKVE